MLTHTKGFVDGTDAGPADSSSYIAGAPDDRLAAVPSFNANAGGASGPFGGGSTPQPSFFDLAGATDGGSSSAPPSGPGAGDRLATFLDGLRKVSSAAGLGEASSLPAGPPATLLSNGLNADAGVAQLVSALASVTEAHSSYFATPFTASSNDASPHGIVAAATQ